MSAVNSHNPVKIVYDDQAYEKLQNLRNGLLSAVIEKIAELIGTHEPDESGALRVTATDVERAFAAVAQRMIHDQQKREEEAAES